MAESLSMALAELLRKADAEPDLDTLREGVRVMTQALMELEMAQHLGAERYQHRGPRLRQRAQDLAADALGSRVRVLEQVEGGQRLRRQLVIGRKWPPPVYDAQQHG